MCTMNQLRKVLRLGIPVIFCALAAEERPPAPVPTWSGRGSAPQGYAGKHVFLTPDRHTIIVRLPPDASESKLPPAIIRVPIHNDFEPLIIADVLLESDGRYSYRYFVKNKKEATEPIGIVSLVGPVEDSKIEVQSADQDECWRGAPAYVRVARQPLFPLSPVGRYLTWVRREGRELLPGHSVDCMYVKSSFKPGLTAAWVAAANPPEFD